MQPALDVAVSDERVRALATEILERPRYKNFRPSNFDVLRRLVEAWHAALDWLRNLYDLNPTLYWALLIALCGLCVWMIVQIASALRAALREQPTAPATVPPRSLRDFVREAHDLAHAGEHLEAAHRLLLANLRTLAEARVIPLHPEDGNHAVCRKLSESKLPLALREQLAGLILETERAWFGRAAADAETSVDLYRRWTAATSRLAQVSQT